jgi:uncharacterized SAM-binding protein YcdF (DUF218 family)
MSLFLIWVRTRKLWLGLLACLVLLFLEMLLFSREVLTVDSGSVTADALVMLGGDPIGRPKRASELFRIGAAPVIIVSGADDKLTYEHLLETNGVPTSVILREDKARTTFENAKYSIPILRQIGARRVIIVTSWYHSRRALACFQHLAPDITFYSRPDYHNYYVENRRYVNAYIWRECPKLIGYWIWHGVRPF